MRPRGGRRDCDIWHELQGDSRETRGVARLCCSGICTDRTKTADRLFLSCYRTSDLPVAGRRRMCFFAIRVSEYQTAGARRGNGAHIGQRELLRRAREWMPTLPLRTMPRCARSSYTCLE